MHHASPWFNSDPTFSNRTPMEWAAYRPIWGASCVRRSRSFLRCILHRRGNSPMLSTSTDRARFRHLPYTFGPRPADTLYKDLVSPISIVLSRWFGPVAKPEMSVASHATTGYPDLRHGGHYCPPRGSEPRNFFREFRRHKDYPVLAQGLLRSGRSAKGALR